MRFNEFATTNKNHSVAPTKSLTPQQVRLDALKRQKDNVGQALDTERKRQKVVKAQQNLQKAVSAQQGRQNRVKHPLAGFSAVDRHGQKTTKSLHRLAHLHSTTAIIYNNQFGELAQLVRATES